MVGLGKQLPHDSHSWAWAPASPLWLSYWASCCISFCLLSHLLPSVTQTAHTIDLGPSLESCP